MLLSLKDQEDLQEKMKPCNHQWISVDERLPKNDSTVLINRYQSCAIANFYSDTFKDQQTGITWEDVSHWMPLPEPPENKIYGLCNTEAAGDKCRNPHCEATHTGR